MFKAETKQLSTINEANFALLSRHHGDCFKITNMLEIYCNRILKKRQLKYATVNVLFLTATVKS